MGGLIAAAVGVIQAYRSTVDWVLLGSIFTVSFAVLFLAQRSVAGPPSMMSSAPVAPRDRWRWLIQVAELDLASTAPGVIVYDLQADLTALNQAVNPRIIFRAKVFNGTVWPVVIDRLAGRISCGEPLQGEPQFETPNNRGTIGHANRTNVNILLFLSKDEADYVRSRADSDRMVRFDFTKFELWVILNPNDTAATSRKLITEAIPPRKRAGTHPVMTDNGSRPGN